MTIASTERYSRQIRFAAIGENGQKRLAESRVLVAGCGALGSHLAETMVRAGTGYVRIVDRDFVEVSNLQRQALFDEQDIADQLPKAEAAARKLRRINSGIEIEAHVADIDHRNIRQFAEGVDLILDGMDNFETRFLINDLCLTTGQPWVYGGCLGSHGQAMIIVPGKTGCLRCLMDGPPDAGTAETCDSVGILGPIISIIAAWQSALAIRWLVDADKNVPHTLTLFDVWDGSVRSINTSGLREQGQCPACFGGERLWLAGTRGAQSSILCGRNAVQIRPDNPMQVSLADLATRLQPFGTVTYNPFLARFKPSDTELQMTFFSDGRAIVQGTEDIAAAKTLYTRYIGS